MDCYKLYEPINTLKPVADNVWIVDGPEITMRYLGFGMPFPTRMTVFRLADGALWIHSPTTLTEQLAREIKALGHVRFLVAPNPLHYWWIKDWKDQFPQAVTYAAPGVRKAAAGRFDGFEVDLGEQPPPEWARQIDQVSVRGDFFSEVVFLHGGSRTLVLTDLIENFEPGRIRCHAMRWLTRIGGVCDPDGKTPYDMRLTFLRHRADVRANVRQMLDWQPQQAIVAHGRWYERNAVPELERAFRWVM
ncbi:DUF4336 domain-containing protein [Pseudorhodoplanes sinuspersici]|uniref:DUF4336 domain-containing protein n=1 Tax=Pseudorhodoplanes sinuspersici TaxID=1235591 RepID=A0A1W6ZYN0_9HYPH|nr:DUF4336 domain-containing protein [Pseudorhodoplanes sinuspersici]ARQ02251.1 DUF4336 domain-containing protein [Pseudorhodoplanes sinuspersici]RKE74072.1 uncharacterized protein DUF4336 [Pseudorhodoplanes sinuspersici]